MNDLGQRARAIVDAGRAADRPTGADRDRIKRAVFLQIAATGVVASSAAAAGGLSVGAKAGLAVLAVTLVGGGGVAVWQAQRPAAVKRAPAVVHPREARPVVPTVPAPVEVPVAAEAVEPDEPAKKVERGRRAAPVARMKDVDGADSLNAEVEVLKRAREALRMGRPERALEALAEYDRRFGTGVLGEERQAIAAIAGCRATPGPATRAQAEAFIRKAPASPLRARVVEACIPSPARTSP